MSRRLRVEVSFDKLLMAYVVLVCGEGNEVVHELDATFQRRAAAQDAADKLISDALASAFDR